MGAGPGLVGVEDGVAVGAEAAGVGGEETPLLADVAAEPVVGFDGFVGGGGRGGEGGRGGDTSERERWG